MSTLEDKILDGPIIHYCDADDDDIRGNEDQHPEEIESRRDNKSSDLFVRPDEEDEKLTRLVGARIPGCSVNTGPKAVIEDHKRFISQRDSADDIDTEFQHLMEDDSIIGHLVSKRLLQKEKSSKNFGKVYRLQTGSELLNAIDDEHKEVLIIVLIYVKYSRSCSQVNLCLDQLADEFKQIKFVTLDAGVAGLSDNFKANGVPALLAYRDGKLVKSLVQLEDHLDKDFDASQIKELLNENGLLSSF